MDTIGEYKTLVDALQEAEDCLGSAGRVDPERKAEETKRIITSAGKSLQVLGINALRPAHEGIETVAKLLRNQGKVEFITLDPFSEAFSDREAYEGTTMGRLQTEWDATIADLADAYKRAGDSGDLYLFLHSKKPLLSVVASDYEESNGEMQVNLYTGGEGIRGLKGKTYQLAKGGPSEVEKAFDAAVGFLYTLKGQSETISPNQFLHKIAESRRIWLDKYARRNE